MSHLPNSYNTLVNFQDFSCFLSCSFYTYYVTYTNMYHGSLSHGNSSVELC